MKLNVVLAVTWGIVCSLSSLSMAQTSPAPLALVTNQPWLENNTATGLVADYILGCYSSSGVEYCNTAGDPHAAVSPAWVVLKANDSFVAMPRNPNGLFVSNAFPGEAISDSDFWPSWFTPGGDGKIIYDQNGPYNGPGSCTNMIAAKGGRWIAAEMGYNSNQSSNGLAFAVSATDDPTGAWDFWWLESGYGGTIPCISGNNDTVCPVDYPWIGFDWNWVVFSMNNFYPPPYPPSELAILSRQDWECSNSIVGWLNGETSISSLYPVAIYGGPDSALYMAWNYDGPAGQIAVTAITGTAQSPVWNISSGLPTNRATVTAPAKWGDLPNLGQADSTIPVDAGPDDDRITGGVVRNGYLWLPQTGGYPQSLPTSWVSQWWQIAVDGTGNASGISSTPTYFGQIGGSATKYDGWQYDSINPSIAVNSLGDVLIGFETLANGGGLPPPGYLNGAYVYKDHSAAVQDTPYLYTGGNVGPFGTPQGNSLRTGDYTGTVVDPKDDYTFFTVQAPAVDYDGASTFGWGTTWAFVAPPNQKRPLYVGGSQGEQETCTAGTGSGTPCLFSVPVNVAEQPGDLLLLAVQSGAVQKTTPVTPSGWTVFPISGSTNPWVASTNSCNNGNMTSWILGHIFSSSDTVPYPFSITVHDGTDTCTDTHYKPEITWQLAVYRGAASGFANYTVYGYGTTSDQSSVSTGQITVPANMMLVDVFEGAYPETNEDNGDALQASFPVSGYPQLSFETENDPNLPFYVADAWSSASQTMGGYSINLTDPTTGNAVKVGPTTGFHVLVSPAP